MKEDKTDMTEELKFRQIHLDFHTSEALKNIGSKFDKHEFQNTLKLGHVNAITLFSKCHHGWSYHPTKVNEIHPNLNFDLLGAQLEACKEIGVHTQVYISAGFDENQAKQHPEWLVRQKDETIMDTPDFVSFAGFHRLCFNTGYLDLLLKEIEEVMIRYNPSGIFLDICAIHPCYCSKCRQEIIARGKSILDPEAIMEQADIVYDRFATKVRETVRKYSDTCMIFNNSGHVIRGRRDVVGYGTHLELESLPTGGWGYDHFPMSAAYAAGLSMDYLGMTGKFHYTWGEFGGFKHPNALIYETSLSLALGAKCSIGDQLHPLGKLDEGTYEVIGKAYSEVEKKEPWCSRAENCFDIGILSEEAVNQNFSNGKSDVGANRMMLEGKFLYRIIDLEENFNKFKVVILPDAIRINSALKAKLTDYLKNGGKILASGMSGVNEENDDFAIDFGVKMIGKAESGPDYMTPKFKTSTGNSAHVMYSQGYLVDYQSGEIVADREDPYFQRDITHFTSHHHAPNNSETSRPAAVLGRNTAYIGWDVFSDYASGGELHCKEIVLYMLNSLIGKNKTVEVNLPDKAVTTLTVQRDKHRYINHLLFAHTTLRGYFDNRKGKRNLVEVIEDVVPLYKVDVKVNVPENIKKVYLAPQMQELAFKLEDGKISYQVPEVMIHQMVVMEY